jgi:predicted solute-binding protein
MAPSSHPASRKPLRIGAVGYLNARPLTWALDRDPQRWQVRYDVPSVCAALLHAGEVDLGLVPSVEYLRAPDYCMVPGIGVGSRGPVASVAMYSRRDISDIRTIALDTSSRTSVALIRVLCRHHFRIEPKFVSHGPDLAAMTREADAALLIGDPAFDADHESLGLRKIDLGEEWGRMTGLPFIYAAWTGRAGVANADDVRALQVAQAEGVRAAEDIASEYGRGDAQRAAKALAYLRDNVKYGIGPDEAKGLQLFLDHAADLGLAPARRRLEFY